ncbi:hypothetical protein NADFUDRAFT_50997 [Nadsonia fulvescens var. elongata DSM 6958]|uniref:Zn(2)-C6 fungal-type domain-containing protein n=1 Tax=Nadsonia fulvescens var. elongata DSM 6958 TaxID=857566 RepID=A0A1E3PL84_9ASCO|nr:hypothetical protein NADFUDRAFT_50997 [Nadsonia fulvescens var. elongata DSM 6958]
MVVMMLPGPIKRVHGEPDVVISARTGKPKRKKALRACNHCQKSHLTCDNSRPCQRCVLRGLGDTCQDGVRKKAKYLNDSLSECCSSKNGDPFRCSVHSKSSHGGSEIDSGQETTVLSDNGSGSAARSRPVTQSPSEISHVSYNAINMRELSSQISTDSVSSSNTTLEPHDSHHHVRHNFSNTMLVGPSSSKSKSPSSIGANSQSNSMPLDIDGNLQISATVNPDHIQHQHGPPHQAQLHPSFHHSHNYQSPAHPRLQHPQNQQHQQHTHHRMISNGHPLSTSSFGFSSSPSSSLNILPNSSQPLATNNTFSLHGPSGLNNGSFGAPNSLISINSRTSSRDNSASTTGTTNTPISFSAETPRASLSKSTASLSSTSVPNPVPTFSVLPGPSPRGKPTHTRTELKATAPTNNLNDPNLSQKQEFQSMATSQEYLILSNILYSGRSNSDSGSSMYSPGMNSVDGDNMIPLSSSRRDFSLDSHSLSSTLTDPSINLNNPLDRDFLTLSQNTANNKNFFADLSHLDDTLDPMHNTNSDNNGGSPPVFSTTELPDWASQEAKRRPISFMVSADLGERSTVFREPDDIYSSVKKPFSHTPGFHGLVTYLRSRFDKPKLMQMAKCMADYRPSFIACTNKLKEADLIFMEQCFQRTLLEYEKFISLSGTPTIIWRRSGQVAAVGKEFCMLTGWTRESLLGSTRFIVELMDDDSAVEYFQIFSKIAFGDSRGASMSACTLLTPTGKRLKTSCIWTLRRDVFGIPMMVIGNFLPILF